MASMTYLPVGWGSHHWDVTDETGSRWFVTVDELDARRWSRTEALGESFRRLESSLATATALAALGMGFVHAPVPSRDGRPLTRLEERFALSAYPYVTGESFTWGEFSSAAHRMAVTGFIAAIHSAPEAAGSRALTDDLTIACRDALAYMLGTENAESTGPYSEPARTLIKASEPMLRSVLRRYDELAAGYARAEMVLTHGEPHPGNTMRTPDGWLMIDWDTTMISLPERDLWDLDPGDGSVLDAYEQSTGRKPEAGAMELFRLRWDLTDLSLAASRFSGPHGADANDEETFSLISVLLTQLSALRS